jgi:hypothetical protein
MRAGATSLRSQIVILKTGEVGAVLPHWLRATPIEYEWLLVDFHAAERVTYAEGRKGLSRLRTRS